MVMLQLQLKLINLTLLLEVRNVKNIIKLTITIIIITVIAIVMIIIVKIIMKTITIKTSIDDKVKGTPSSPASKEIVSILVDSMVKKLNGFY